MYEHHLFGNTPVCPNCGKKQDGALGGKTAPHNGSVCVCAYCASINIFEVTGNTYKLHVATVTERCEMQDAGILEKVVALQDYVKSRITVRKSKQ